MRPGRFALAARALAWAAALLGAAAGVAAAATDPAPAAGRVEARSQDLVAVGVVQGDRMRVRLTRSLDNAPVGNAVVEVMLRGTTHPTLAEADGSYSFQTPDLALAGPAAVEFLVTSEGRREALTGTLEAAAPSRAAEEGSGGSRQLGWWMLNFAVCIGFLWLWSRRKSAD